MREINDYHVERQREVDEKRQRYWWKKIQEYRRPSRSPQLLREPLAFRAPPELHHLDNRFEKCQPDRRYVCDSCGDVVEYCSYQRNWQPRSEGKFQGSYLESCWDKNVPPKFVRRAYEARLIDCTWHCHRWCHASITGVQDRMARPAQYREQARVRNQRWRATSSEQRQSLP